MRRWILCLLAVFISFSIPRPAFAQNDISIQNLEVEVWPEYDQPSVLVIYRITLSSQTQLPAELVFRIPRSAGDLAALAEQTENGLFNIPNYSKVGEDGDWVLFQFTTTTPQLQLEYYEPLMKNGSERAYTFRWPGDYAVDSMTVIVQQPRTATNMRLQPPTGTSGPGSDGLTYFNVPVGSVSVGNTFKLQIAYTKPDDTLTQPQAFEAVTPALPANRTPPRSVLNTVIPWVLAGLGLVLIGVGVFWYLRTERTPSRKTPRRPRREEAPSPGRSPQKESPIFCHQCGKRAQPGDVFCRTCGTKLRR
ncbi:MAG TPA: zinc ribbon domain-containing protein [Anaerolinea thermolimosa]|uniref:Zinc ribbon domain-containing protein n=1 Tax=Anaerolinea thermolimosa TaxID=229919 RepID=A0A3D1JDL7_9CHLR|nr:zinc ribbon domain-containing protein [Anaerolinea thermolimosa]GAP07591.1 protein containing zinc-ribbon domain [Anaerolinea thermolimosa]HCE16680.1 zinc ribbon domain-containing protein [Anaerolinea thermolimosa]